MHSIEIIAAESGSEVDVDALGHVQADLIEEVTQRLGQQETNMDPDGSEEAGIENENIDLDEDCEFHDTADQ